MKRDIRIALVVCRSVVGSTDENLSRIKQWSFSARDNGAELACFPELGATGYHIGDQIHSIAETIPGPSSRSIENIATETGICVLAGIAEKNGTRIHAAHILARPKAGISGVYRKLHLGPPETKVFAPGTQEPFLSKIRGLNLGIQLCYDAHFPELSTSMALKGADIIIIPHASPGRSPDEKLASWMRHLPARAFDNGVYVAAVNPVGENRCSLSFPGVAVLLSPEGKILQKYTGCDETMLIADLSAGELESVRLNPMKYFLPNRRPDMYGI